MRGREPPDTVQSCGCSRDGGSNLFHAVSADKALGALTPSLNCLSLLYEALGSDLAGDVVALGAQVESFQVGDAVFGLSTMSVGARAEYIAAPHTELALKPPGLDYETVAAAGLSPRSRSKLQPRSGRGERRSSRSPMPDMSAKSSS
jgi:hypothetical protein